MSVYYRKLQGSADMLCGWELKKHWSEASLAEAPDQHNGGSVLTAAPPVDGLDGLTYFMSANALTGHPGSGHPYH